MSRNKNGLIRIRNCSECGASTRNYRIVVKREMEWNQVKRAWLPIRSERAVCRECLMRLQNKHVKGLDTILYTKAPELEVKT